MESSENILVAKVAQMSIVCPNSVVLQNKHVLHETQTQVTSDNVVRVAAQIRELNECLEGEKSCGLSNIEIRMLINNISTSDLE